MVDEPARKRGRPRISFDNGSQSQQYQMAKDLAAQTDFNVKYLTMALNAAKKHHKIKDEPPKCDCASPKKHTPESGLAFFIQGDYTKAQYKSLLRDQREMYKDSKKHPQLYPSYNKISEAKKQCQLPFETLSEKEIVVDLQQMLDKTAVRLINALNSVEPLTRQNLKLYSSVGMDSASGYKNPHQEFAEEVSMNDQRKSHQQLFTTALSIIGLRNDEDEEEWTNHAPQSKGLIRPLRTAFEKETDETTVQEYNRIKTSIDGLQPYEFTAEDGRTFLITYDVQTTGMDQKCINAITGNRDTQKCAICRLTQRKYKDTHDQTVPINDENLKFGLSLLHCHIRCLEFLLALSQKTIFKQWRSVPKDGELLQIIVINFLVMFDFTVL